MDKITTVIFSSQIPTHPSSEIIDETIKSVRDRLDGEILILLDGVRTQQEDRREDYEEYRRRLLLRYKDDPKVTPVYFKDHMHQSGMMLKALEMIDTPLVHVVEQDTPLVNDIPFDRISEAFNGVNMIRFSHEASVLDVHKHMFLETKGKMINDVPLVRTIQFSARPHVARTEFYRWILHQYFPKDPKEFIEDRMYGVVLKEGLLRGWEKFKMCVYAPSGTFQRSLHNDGRRRPDGSREPKYDGVGSG